MTHNHRNRPKAVPHKPMLPQCCAPVDTSSWAEHYCKRRTARMAYTGYDLTRCNKGGTVHLYSHDFCAQHAGILALAVVLGEVSEAEALRRGPEIVSQLSAGN